MEKKENQITEESQLKHLAFIMDGNGRWAKKHGMPREYGHKFGAETFRKIMDHCCHLGIHYQTFYVFSTENWKRPKKEVDTIMKLLDKYLDDCEDLLDENDVRFIFIGDETVFPKSIRDKIDYIEKKSKNNSYIVNIALNYGSHSEIVAACNKLISQGYRKITEDDMTKALYTCESPDPDMIIRTGGDMRLSNYLMWQAAYSELYFTDILWPDFKAEDVDDAIENFKSRKRRFGGV